MTTHGSPAPTSPGAVPSLPALPLLLDDAVHWLTGTSDPRPAITVLELNAGIGHLTEQLVRCGHRVIATDPSPQHLAALRSRVVPFAVGVSGAEAIPSPSQTVDVVICNPGTTKVDPVKALGEVNRVLRPGGAIAVLWVTRDEGVPWVRRLSKLIGLGLDDHPLREALQVTDLFVSVTETSWRTWQRLNRAELIAYAKDSGVTDEGTLAAVGALYDDYDRGPDGLQMPLLVRALRAIVLHRVVEATEADMPAPHEVAGHLEATDLGPEIEPEFSEPIEPPEDPGTLLIDFT